MSEWKYEGKWNIAGNDNWYEGILFIDEKIGLIGLKLYVDSNDSNIFSFGSEINTSIDVINGNLLRNNKVALINCDVKSRHEYLGSHTELLIAAKWAFWGINYKTIQEVKYNKYSLKLNNVLNWCELCWFEHTEMLDFRWINKEKVTLKLSDELLVDIYPICDRGTISAIVEEEIVIKQYIGFEFKYNHEVTVDDFYADYQILEKFIAIGSDNIPSVEEVHCYNCKNELIKQLRVFSSIKKNDSNDMVRFDMLYRLEDVLNNNQRILQNWNEKREKILPAINLYYSLLQYTDMPLEMRFLNIVQALETYHSRFKYNDKLKKYKAHLKELFKCEVEDIPSPHKEAYYCITQADENVGYIILKSRLVDLFNDDFKLNMYPLYINGEVVDKYFFIDAIVDSRHYYTHYGKSKEEKALRNLDLIYGISVLMNLFEYHFLIELEFDSGYAHRLTRDRLSKQNHWYREHIKK